MKKTVSIAVIAASIGLLIGITMNPSPVFAQFVQWARSEVVPVVIVEPTMNGFVPKGAGGIQPSWRKDQVVALILVKPSMGGFVPAEGGYGSMIGNMWQKDEVRPFVFLKPNNFGAFVPAN